MKRLSWPPISPLFNAPPHVHWSWRRGWGIRSVVSSNNLIVCRVTEQTSEQKILLRKRSAISGREEETMSESDGESQDITSLIFYFFLTCLAVIFIIILFFTCFSGRLCVLMYYMVYKVQVESYLLHIPWHDPRAQGAAPEVTPLIVESEYFPRPSGYHGYCMAGQEPSGDTRAVLLEAGVLLTRSIEIEGSTSLLATSRRERTTDTPANFPKGILTPERKRPQREASVKAVSFNPRTEFKFLDQ